MTGAAIKRIILKTIKAATIPLPELHEQERLVECFDELLSQTQRLQTIYQQKLDALAELKQSILQKAFSGELTQATAADTTSPPFAANVIAYAHFRHASNRRGKTFGRVKGQKTLHLTESIGGMDLGRKPMKDAAGPNDFQHQLVAEDWAKSEQFFEFVQRGSGYDFKKLARFDEMIVKAHTMTKPYRKILDKVNNLLLPMNSQDAEVFATVHAAWNNLILDGADINDEAIIHAARDDWHPDKLKIPKAKFQKAIRLIRDKGLVPDGKAKRVGGQGNLF